MESIKKILPKSIKKAGITKQVQAAMVTDYFTEAVAEVLGVTIAKKAKALYLKDKILMVACLSSVLAQELQLNQRKIINRINKNFDKVIVEKLSFIS
jgi:predicted nucleic acid-binding Zn ribbon protein